jgi:4-cresol dehydrogenase (hydroxylating)
MIGNSMDNGITYLPNGADFMAPCGLEVVLPNGELLRTGMGAMPGNDAWHVYKRGLGPTLDPLFMQSNYGIVTRMGFWLTRKPEAYAPMLLTIPREEQLTQAIDILRELRLDGTIKGVPSIFNTLTAAAQFPDVAELMAQVQGQGPLPDEAIQRIADETGLGRWGMRTALWGDAAVVEHQLAKVREAWGRMPGATVRQERIFDRDSYDQITGLSDKIQAGIPSIDLLDAIPPGVGHIGFSPAVPLVGAKVREVVDFMRDLVENQAKVNFIGGILVINERCALIVGGITFVVADEEQTRRAYETARMLVREAGRRGYGEYRAHLDFMDLAADQYSWGDHAYRRFCETIKDAVDPNGILSPGRHGIWPAGLR